MIQGNIKFGERAFYPEALNRVIGFLKSHDLNQLACGRYDIDGDNIFVMIIELKTQDRKEKRPESHKEYIDVHCMIHGEERDYFFSNTGKMQIDTDWNDDIRFYKNDVEIKESCCTLLPGDFVVFFPEDIHTPACTEGKPRQIKKAIAKIAVQAV